MQTYVILLRGINVGGKNRLPMAGLAECLEALGCSQVRTYIASGNAVVQTDKPPEILSAELEAALPRKFVLDSQLIRVLVLGAEQIQSVVNNKPAGFGDQAGTFHSDVIFLIGISAANALLVFNPRSGVDRIWPGDGVIYSERLSAERTKSRLGTIIGTPLYASMTIRNWNTVMKLYELTKASDSQIRLP